MKELSIEEKAKRYDEVIAMPKECITYVPDEAVNKYMLDMFPELKDVEFEQDRWQVPCKLNPEKDLSNPIDHWQDLRERAAIAVFPQCLKTVQDVLLKGGSLIEDTVAKQVAVDAVEYADALVKKLKGE